MQEFLRNFTGVSLNTELGLKVISHVTPSEGSQANHTVKLGQGNKSLEAVHFPFSLP